MRNGMDISPLIIFSLVWSNEVFCSERGFCYNEYSKFAGSCYGLIPDPLPVYDAESECNKLPGGHVAVFHTQDEYNHLLDLVRPVFPEGAWSGYVFNDTLSKWGFIDGSSGPTGSWICCDLNAHDNGNPAYCARFHVNGLNDRGCGSSLPYVCSHPEWKPSLEILQNTESAMYLELLDNNTGSCINSLGAFNGLDHYVVWLQLSQWLGHFSAAVTFSTHLKCVDRQVLSVWQKHSECKPGGYLKSCYLVTTGNDVISTCVYNCPCSENGCSIALIDHIEDYQKYPSDVCEIEFN